ncbi:hypothetical protein [Candidatus Alkanophaga liquidiphilum]|nr:hypothetical protein [Candidatus Alkanophaga liquidiphilum]RLG36941.1 MAG: hypothetical protein DRN91_06695 [Candidatus Alkanophagales archaeon]
MVEREKGERRSCLKCKHYVMSCDFGENRGRTCFDLCDVRGRLPTAAFSFHDVCCAPDTIFCMQAFECLEDIAENCEYYEEKEE